MPAQGRAEIAEAETFQILYTNDIESVYEPLPAIWRSDMTHIGGLAKLASLIARYRVQEPKSLLLDAGDLFTGSLSKATQGRLVFDLYSAIGYDAVNIGNHEFEYGWQTLAFVSQRARFPLLNANIFYENTDIPFGRAYVILEVGSIRVAVLGLMGIDAFINTMMPSHRQGLRIVAPETVAAHWVPRLRQEADVVLLLTHQGRTAPMQTDKEADPDVQRGFEEEYALAGAVDGIDLIVAGHTDHGLQTPVRHPDTQTLIVETFGQGMHLGVLNLRYQSGQPLTVLSSDLVPVNADELPSDTAVLALIQTARSEHPELAAVAGTLVGHAPRKYYGESVVGNLVADALRAHAKTDIGMITPGALRADLTSGSVTVEQIRNVFPFLDRVSTIRLTGALLKDVVRKGLQREYGLPQYSGLTLTAELAESGEESLISLKINSLPVIDTKQYTLATGSFTATGGEGYHLLTPHIIGTSEALVADVLVAYFKSKGRVEAPDLGRQTLR
ncbi:MAG: bifunctional metallophosphatase/5'-nucleotidase [Gammaproteobacteria bacterium]|jgi:2',3'-cyclic-nucleotide 2'-phosphodiesterase (5'-nucleotidase family)|nr:bifunctional metallophosphatase/5'-nucleotidase [Gammaproteobacteria bacterium]MBT5054625.1 bifunctional metallophosphatase/5'-nucleotidase [Gammaproteobacteria bacterium]